VFGSFGAIIVCVNILPKFMGRTIRDDAIAAETAQQAGVKVLGADQEAAAPSLVGRIYELTTDPQRTVADIENANPATTITIERVKRDGKFIEVSPALALRQGDTVLAVGRRDAVVASAPLLGKEVFAVDGMELTLEKREIVLTNKEFDGKTVDQIRQATAGGVRHGIFVTGLSRMGKALPMQPDTVVQAGDLVSIFGAEQDVKRVAALVGDVIVPSAKTDFVYLGAGLVVGLLVGLLSVKLGNIPLTLGSGGGALLAGLLFGWYRARRQTFGALPPAAVQLLKDLGLAGFVVVVGLSSGLQAVETVKQLGLTIFGVGVVVTIVPMLLTMLFGKYVLRYANTAVFAGALSGSRSANPAFGEVLGKAENAIPTVPFAITYALANVFLTLLGPLIVALV
jgi:putative transport protein